MEASNRQNFGMFGGGSTLLTTNRTHTSSPSLRMNSFLGQDDAERPRPVAPGIWHQHGSKQPLPVHTPRYARSKCHTQIAKISFDEKIFDLTAEGYTSDSEYMLPTRHRRRSSTEYPDRPSER